MDWGEETSGRRAAMLAAIAVVTLAALALAGVALGGQRDTTAAAAGADEAAPSAAATEGPGWVTPTPQPTAAEIPALQPTPTVTQLAPDANAALLPGRERRLWLFYGGGDPLQRLDLTTGAVDLYGLRARPTLATGGELVLEVAGAIGWVGLDDPGEMAEGWIVAEIKAGPEDGQLWFWSAPSHEWTLRDLRTNLQVERRWLPAITNTDALDPDLAAFAGSLYAWDGETYTRVGAGDVIAFDDDVAVVATCGDSLDDCKTTWLDRQTWTPIDDAERGDWPEPEPSVRSPDGVWEAEVIFPGRVEVRNTAAAEAARFDFAIGDEGGQLLFVEEPVG